MCDPPVSVIAGRNCENTGISLHTLPEWLLWDVDRLTCTAPTTTFTPPGQCEAKAECQFQYTSASDTYSYDISSLCAENGEYTIDDNMGHSYSLNICGTRYEGLRGC